MWHWEVTLYADDGGSYTETFGDYKAALEWMVTLMRAGRQKNYQSWELKNTQSLTIR